MTRVRRLLEKRGICENFEVGAKVEIVAEGADKGKIGVVEAVEGELFVVEFEGEEKKAKFAAADLKSVEEDTTSAE